MIAEHVEGADLLLRADPTTVAARLADPAFAAQWAGGLHLEVYQDRGDEGRRHLVTGALVGTCEWWIESLETRGCVVHFWLRGRPTRDGDHRPVREGPGVIGALARRRGRLLVLERTRRWRRAMFRLRTDLDAVTAGRSDDPVGA